MKDKRSGSKDGMTYDKVQFAFTRHNFGQHRNCEDDQPVNPTVEGERVSISPVRQKRKSSAVETTLPYIKKEAVDRKGSINAISYNELKSGRLQLEEGKNGIENHHSMGCEIIRLNQLENKATKIHGRGEDNVTSTYPKYFANEKQSLDDEMSVNRKSRHSNGNGSDIIDSDKSCKSGLSGKEGREGRDEAAIFSNVKCEHMQAGGKDFSVLKKWEEHKNIKIDPDKCMICEVTEATAKYASVDANRLLLEIVYPHEFYDKFQRSGKKTKANINQKNLNSTKEQISICKPVPAASKTWRREKTTILTSQPSASDQPDPRFTDRNRLRERSEQDLNPQKRIKRDGENETRKEIHLKCKAKNNALVVTDDGESQKLVLNGLKGWILKKDEMCKNKIHKEIKTSLYQVNSLGMKFSIPEYNNALSDRKAQSSRFITCIATPRPLDTQPPIRRSVTQNSSPRSHVTSQTPPRDVQTVSSQPVNSLYRGYTHVPKLFSDTSTAKDGSFKGFQLAKANTNSDKKPVENGNSFHRKSSKLSLPPITSNLKSRSLTLTQF